MVIASYNMQALPELETGTTMEQVNRNLKVVKNWLFQLDEQLRYNLYNIEEDNLTEETVDRLTSISGDVKAELSVLDGKITAAVEGADGKYAQLQITVNGIQTQVGDAEGNISALQQTATALTSQVQDANGNISALQQTASSLSTQIQNANGDISSLQQTASGLQTSVSNLSGSVSSVSQTANKINWIVASGTSASSMSLTSQMLSIITSQIQLHAPDLSNYAKISVNSYGLYLEPNAGTVYIGSSNGYVYARNSFDAYYIHCKTQITSDGNITTPNGQVGAYSGRFTGWCYAPDWTNGSDRKLKDGIETLDEDTFTAFILSLKPVQYRYKADASQKTRFGFIAQDIREELGMIGYGESGALVTAARLDPDDEEDTLTLSYNDLIAPLVCAVQRQEREFEELKGRLEAMEGKANAGV